MKTALRYLGVAALFLATLASAQDKWTVHEWGTFTSLQDEAGRTLGGINTDDEPVPRFVHRLSNFALLPTHELPFTFYQGAPSCHPDVTMRLETPVIYFHPPKSKTSITSADVLVKFRGGWLTEFFPDARPTAPGLENGQFNFGKLRSDTISSLEWKDLKIGGDEHLPETSAHVWTSPRAVDAALVQAHVLPVTQPQVQFRQSPEDQTENERFLFYRGVAHIDAPLKVSRENNAFAIRSQIPNTPDFPAKNLNIQHLWLVQIQPDGTVAFRTLSPLTAGDDTNKILARTEATFKPSDFSSANLKKLRSSLEQALTSDGLFNDEAQALLNTWELSYFKSHGLRLFFLVPRAWTDYYLPLNVSLPANITRTMVGRIELVTPEQRSLLHQLASYSVAEIREQARQLGSKWPTPALIRDMDQLKSGKKHLRDTISVPESYQTYLDLGRFRETLVLLEAAAHPTPGLTNFVSNYRLHGS